MYTQNKEERKEREAYAERRRNGGDSHGRASEQVTVFTVLWNVDSSSVLQTVIHNTHFRCRYKIALMLLWQYLKSHRLGTIGK